MQADDTAKTPRSFSFVKPLGRSQIDHLFRRTPMWDDAPLAPAVAVQVYDRGAGKPVWRWQVLRCPWCGESHMHRACDGVMHDRDPREFLGGRKAHCFQPHFEMLTIEYRLVAIELVDGHPDWSEELDRFFPLMPEQSQAILPHSRVTVWVHRMTEGAIRIIAPNDDGKFPGQRTAINADLRSAVWQKSRGICWYCGCAIDPFLNFHVDHIHPVADGGSNHIDNLAPTCRHCNLSKGDRSLEAFRARRGGGLFWFEVARMGGAS